MENILFFAEATPKASIPFHESKVPLKKGNANMEL